MQLPQNNTTTHTNTKLRVRSTLIRVGFQLQQIKGYENTVIFHTVKYFAQQDTMNRNMHG